MRAGESGLRRLGIVVLFLNLFLPFSTDALLAQDEPPDPPASPDAQIQEQETGELEPVLVIDTDGDGIPDDEDPTPNGDADGDGIDTLADNCADTPNTDQLDADSDGIGDACDTTPNGDTDGDGIDNLADNCTDVPNADQLDADGDGIGDACDPTPAGEQVEPEARSAAEADDTSAEITAAGALTVTKTAHATEVSAGEEIGFTITVENTTGQMQLVGLEDALPMEPGLAWRDSAASCWILELFGEATLSCAGVMLWGGQSFSVAVTSPTTEASCGTYANTARLTGSHRASSNEAVVTVVCDAPVPEPNVTITKTADRAEVEAGEPIGFEITVTNDGDGAAEDVSFTDELPGGDALDWQETEDACEIVRDSDTGIQTLTCTAITLSAADNQSDADTFSVHVTSETAIDGANCGIYENTASLTGDYSGTSETAITEVLCPAPPEPEVSISKSSDAAQVTAGEPIGFTISVSNTGEVEATDVGFTDALPDVASQTWEIDSDVPGDVTCAIAEGTLDCSGIGLAAETGMFSIHVTSATDEEACGAYENTATLGAPYQGTSETVSTEVVCPEPEPDVSIAKTADADEVETGQQIGFDITVTNSGNGPAEAVGFTDVLPGGNDLDWQETEDACVITRDADSGTQTLTCSEIELSAADDQGDGDTFSVHVTSDTTEASCGVYENTATLNDPYQGTSETVSVEVVCPAPPEPNVSITKIGNADPVSGGEDVEFTITVTNDGTAEATGVGITDALPNTGELAWSIATTVPDGASCDIVSGTLECSDITLAPDGGIASVTVSATLDAPPDPSLCVGITNTASVSIAGETTESDPATVAVTCPEAEVVFAVEPLEATVGNGETIGFVYTVTNNGPKQIASGGWSLYDLLPLPEEWSIADYSDEFECQMWSSDGLHRELNCSEVSKCDPGLCLSFPAGTSRTVTVSRDTPASVTDCGTPITSSNARFTYTLDGQSYMDLHDSASVTVQCDALSIIKTADAGQVHASDEIGYTITATNTTSRLQTFSLTDALPSGPDIDWTTDSRLCSISGQPGDETLSCLWITLLGGESVSIHVTSATTDESCGTYTNTATGRLYWLFRTTSNEATIEVLCQTTLAVDVTPDGDEVEPGDGVGFDISVENTGSVDARDLTLEVPLPGGGVLGWSVTSNTFTSGSCEIDGGALVCATGLLPAGQSRLVTVTGTNIPAEVASCDLDLTTTATAQAFNAGPASDDGSYTIVCEPDVTIAKAPVADEVTASDDIGFEITVTNDGFVEAEDVAFTDALPSGDELDWVLSGDPAECTISDGTLTCEGIALDPDGGSFSVTVMSPTDPMPPLDTCATGLFYTNENALLTGAYEGESGPASVTVTCPASLAFSMAPENGTVGLDDEIAITFTVRNYGTVDSPLWRLQSQFPGDGWFISEADAPFADVCELSQNEPEQAGLFCESSFPPPSNPFPAQETRTMTVSRPVTMNDCHQTIVVDGIMNFTDANTERTDSASVTVECPNVVIEKGAAGDAVSPGAVVEFTVTAHNTTDAELTNVTFTDTLPWSEEITWTTPDACVESNGALDCSIASIPAGQSASITISGTLAAYGELDLERCGTTITNTATLTGAHAAGTDIDTVTAGIDVLCPSLGITKTNTSATGDSVEPGDTIVFEIMLTNAGEGSAIGVALTDALPHSDVLEWTSNLPQGCALDSGVVTCTTLTVPAEGLASFTVAADVPDQPGDLCGATIANTAEFKGVWASFNPGDGTNTASVEVACAPNVTITKTNASTDNEGDPTDVVEAGDTIAFEIAVTNDGAAEATDVGFIDALPDTGYAWTIADSASLPDGVSCGIDPDTRTLTCDGITLQPAGDAGGGDTLAVTVTSRALADSATCETGTIFTNDSAALTGAHAGVSNSASVTVTCPPEGTVVFTAEPLQATVVPGETIGFVLTVANYGTALEYEWYLSSVLPWTEWSLDPESDGFLIDACLFDQWTPVVVLLCDGGAYIALDNPAFPAYTTYSAIVTRDAEASTDDCGTIAIEPGFRYKRARTDLYTDWAESVSVTVECSGVVIQKAATAGTVTPDGEIGFTINLRNYDAVEATDVGFTDDLPGGSAFGWEVTAPNPLPNGVSCPIVDGTLTCTGIDLAAESDLSVTVSGTVPAEPDPAQCGPGGISNTATLSAPYSGDASASVELTCVIFTVEPLQATVAPGETIGFVYTVTNHGPEIEIWFISDFLRDPGAWQLDPDAFFTGNCLLRPAGINTQVWCVSGTPIPAASTHTMTVMREATLDHCGVRFGAVGYLEYLPPWNQNRESQRVLSSVTVSGGACP